MTTNRESALSHAVQALIVLADAKRGMATSDEIADVIGIHPVAVRRLLGVLRAEGIVESRRGPKGGWAIARDPARITLAQIHLALIGEPEVATPASLDAALVEAHERYAESLASVTLASILGV